jgi:glycosyltransferase involved in cell wall biosynthesis
MNKVVSLLFYRIITSYADGIIVISERLFEQYSLLRIPVLKLYNSVEIRQLAVDLEEKNETTTFLYSGTFGIKDAVQDLLRAFIRVSQDYTNVKLVLTGRNESDYFQECMELIQTNERICYLGYLDSDLLEKAYRNADVLVATRNSSQFADYGFPYKLSEYLSFGKPVIASAVSDIPMLFTDYEDILLVEPSNIESIAKKMKFAIDNRHMLKGIAEKGFDKCNRYFSINRIGKDLSDFLTTI